MACGFLALANRGLRGAGRPRRHPRCGGPQARQATGGSRLLAWFRGSRLVAWFQAGIPGAGRAVARRLPRRPGDAGRHGGTRGRPGTSPASGGRTALKTATIVGVTVLTSAQGFTLYWFAPDTPSRSACYGTCAGYWPPVTGRRPSAGPGIPGTNKRTGGTTQATYNRHPLYAYAGDTAPGQAFGNNLNLNGGLWHEVTVTG